MLLIKSAILLEWLRIFSPKGKHDVFFWGCHAVLWTNALWFIVSIIIVNTAITPRAAIWDVTIPNPQKHVNTRASNLVSAVLNLVFDLVILVLPQKIIWKLRMHKSRKVGISVIFAVGVVYVSCLPYIIPQHFARLTFILFRACITAGARLVMTVHHLESPDATYNFASMGLWSVGEATCGYLVFGVPAIPKLIQSVDLHKVRSSFRAWAGTSLQWLRRPSQGGDYDSWRRSSRAHNMPYQQMHERDLIPDSNTILSTGELQAPNQKQKQIHTDGVELDSLRRT